MLLRRESQRQPPNYVLTEFSFIRSADENDDSIVRTWILPSSTAPPSLALSSLSPRCRLCVQSVAKEQRTQLTWFSHPFPPLQHVSRHTLSYEREVSANENSSLPS